MIAGKSIKAGGTAKCFGFMCGVDRKPRRRLFQVLQSQGMQMNQQMGGGTASAATAAAKRQKRTRETITRAEFDELKARVERLSQIVWSQLFESGAIEEDDQLFNEQEDYEPETALPV